MEIDDLIKNLHHYSTDSNDLIVINGGEPTVHPYFYDLISKLCDSFSSEIIIYTNASLLSVPQLPNTIRLSFVIPIHGSETIHNTITQKNKSYSSTIHNLQLLNEFSYRYRLKFIINNAMIAERFIINDFVNQYNLNPEEIILARLNSTKKSVKNGITIPTHKQITPYLHLQIQHLQGNRKIKLLDIPPCFLKDDLQIGEKCGIPDFYFNDPYNSMKKRKYYKEIKIGSNCDNCINYQKCKLMERSYLTLSICNNNLFLERE